MFLSSIFILSGLALVALTLAKRREETSGRTNLLLRLISRGDEHFHELNTNGLHFYSMGKEKFGFWMKKQLPLRAKSLLIKTIALTQELSEKYMGDMRNSRLLRKNDGLSEFFKSISEIEKGGEINDPFTSGSEELKIRESTTIASPALTFEQAPTVIPRESKPKKKKQVEAIESPLSASPILKPRHAPLIHQKKRKPVKVLSQSVENVNW